MTMKLITGNKSQGIYAEIYTDIYTTVGTNNSITIYRLDVWENGEGIEDQIQDTLEIAMRCARDDYGIPLDAWQQVEE